MASSTASGASGWELYREYLGAVSLSPGTRVATLAEFYGVGSCGGVVDVYGARSGLGQSADVVGDTADLFEWRERLRREIGLPAIGDHVVHGCGVSGDGGVGVDRRSGDCAGPRVVTAPAELGAVVRGPNWHRNRATRIRNRVRKAVARENYVAAKAVEDYEENRVKTPVPFGRFQGKVETDDERRLQELRVKRQIIEEERKLDKLKSPMQTLADAMAMVRMSEAAAKLANNHEVAGWAKTLSDSYAESIARSASVSSSKSFASVLSANDMKRKRERAEALSLAKVPANDVEKYATQAGIVSHSSLVSLRVKVGRALNPGDFLWKDAPFRLTSSQRTLLSRWKDGIIPRFDDEYLGSAY